MLFIKSYTIVVKTEKVKHIKEMLACTQCEKKCACQIIGDMFTSTDRPPRMVTACSFRCRLILRLRSIECSILLLQEFRDFIKIPRIKKEARNILTKTEHWPTMAKEKHLRRLTMHVLKHVPIYSEKLPKTSVDILARLLDQ